MTTTPPPTAAAVNLARDALADLIGACKQAKVDLTAGIRDGDPVHPVSAALTWPLVTAINTLAAIDALPASVPSGEPAAPSICRVIAKGGKYTRGLYENPTRDHLLAWESDGDAVQWLAPIGSATTAPAPKASVPSGEPVVRCELVGSCRKCRHAVGRQSCALARRDIEGAGIPDWCPLPAYRATAQAAPAPAPTDERAAFEAWFLGRYSYSRAVLTNPIWTREIADAAEAFRAGMAARTQAPAAPAAAAPEPADLRALCIDYAIACGELSKGLAEDDPMWAALKSLGARMDAAQAAPAPQAEPVWCKHHNGQFCGKPGPCLFPHCKPAHPAPAVAATVPTVRGLPARLVLFTLRDLKAERKRLAGLSADHGPDGWPAVQMRDISALCDEVARLRAALAAQVLQWLPMDSVPKDGRRVLVAIEGVDRAVVAMWNGGVWETVDGNFWTGRAITHWMPLPAAPGASPQPPQQGREGWGAPNVKLT